MEKVGIILTARTDSERLPSKILKPIKGELTCFEFQILNLKKSKYPIVVAIPFNDSKKDILENILKKHNIPLYQNINIDDEDVLRRIVYCAKHYNFDHIGRVTHDDIFFDNELFDALVSWHLKNNADHTSCPQAPKGIDSEVINVKALELAEAHSRQLKRRENITYYVKRPPFKFIELPLNFRIALDYPEDYETIKKIAEFHEGEFSYNEIRKIFFKVPELMFNNRLPKVSVFISCKNYGKYIEKAITSIKNQSMQDFELILIDDGSEDNTWEIIQKYENIKKIKNNNSISLIKVIEQVSKLCRGDYIMRVDADDWLESNALEIMVNWLDRNQSYNAVFSNYFEYWENNQIDRLIKADELEMPHPACALIRRYAWNDIRVNEGVSCRDGWDFWLKFIQRFLVGHIPEPLWHYRKHGNSLSEKKEALEMEKKIIVNNLKNLLNKKNGDI